LLFGVIAPLLCGIVDAWFILFLLHLSILCLPLNYCLLNSIVTTLVAALFSAELHLGSVASLLRGIVASFRFSIVPALIQGYVLNFVRVFFAVFPHSIAHAKCSWYCCFPLLQGIGYMYSHHTVKVE
jgi:hypothetical protein